MVELREPLEALITPDLERLGLTEQDLLAYALVLGQERESGAWAWGAHRTTPR